jgi:TatD DNase family protein
MEQSNNETIVLVDTHCHLNFHSFKKDFAEIAKAAYDLGVTKIINVGAKLDSSRRAIKLANEIGYCFAAVGVHPHHTDEFLDLGELEKEIDQMIQDDLDSTKKIVAIGECGLDYHEYSSPDVKIAIPSKKNQIELLKLHFHFAKKYDLPLIIHCRDAYSDLISLLQTTDYRPALPAGRLPTLRGVIHCFQGNLDELKQFLELGLYVGYDGYITYPDKLEIRNSKFETPQNFSQSSKLAGQANSNNQNSKRSTYEELVFATPLDRILTETDAPWLTPVPHRGTRNSPSNIKIITEKIAEIKKITFEEVDRTTSDNADRLFFHTN